jgi:hypothetical protein
LFYDPFAAARAKRAVKTTDTVLWPADCNECIVVVVFSNSLAVSVVLTNVVPVIEINHTNATTTTEADFINSTNISPFYRLFPTPVTIPPNTAHFEVELRVKPLVEGISLRFTGVQVNTIDNVKLRFDCIFPQPGVHVECGQDRSNRRQGRRAGQ